MKKRESYRHLYLLALRTRDGGRRGSWKWPITLRYLVDKGQKTNIRQVRETLEELRLALGRSGRGRIPIHNSWRWEHNVWPGRWCVRITVGIRGRGIVPRIRARWGWIWCTWKRLWRVLGKRRRVGCLFSPSGSRLFLVTAHEKFLSGEGVVLRRWGDKYVAKRLRRT